MHNIMAKYYIFCGMRKNFKNSPNVALKSGTDYFKGKKKLFCFLKRKILQRVRSPKAKGNMYRTCMSNRMEIIPSDTRLVAEKFPCAIKFQNSGKKDRKKKNYHIVKLTVKPKFSFSRKQHIYMSAV